MKGGQGVTENLRCARRHASQSEKFAVNEGLDAPTPARVVGLPPRRGSTFFRSERKYQRKHAARRLREKGFYCPFCRRGSQRRAQWSWTAIPNACARSCARLFPPSKWAGLFPSAAYRRSAPPQLALDRLSQRELGYYVAAWVASLHRETGLIFFPLRLALCLLNQRRLGCFAVTWIFLQRKRPAWVQIHTGLLCKP